MITVTGASGHLGRLVVETLLDRGVPGSDIIAVARTAEKAAGLAAREVVVRQADYTRPETLTAALAGTDRLLLVSGSEVGQRVAQHRNVLEAAAAAGVSLLAYTSILHADTTQVVLAPEHQTTEAAIRESELPFVLLRNGWYTENYTENLGPALQYGAILGCARDGRVSAATRADYAAAAATVLTGDGHAGRTYELAGDQAFSYAELAGEVSRQTGNEIVYRDLPPEEYVQALTAAGLPEPVAEMLAGADLGVARGELYDDDGQLRRLIGRPTTPLADAVGAALKS